NICHADGVEYGGYPVWIRSLKLHGQYARWLAHFIDNKIPLQLLYHLLPRVALYGKSGSRIGVQRADQYAPLSLWRDQACWLPDFAIGQPIALRIIERIARWGCQDRQGLILQRARHLQLIDSDRLRSPYILVEPRNARG